MYSYCYVYVFLLLCMFRSRYSVLLCCSMYCMCVNMYCTTATRCEANCSYQIYHVILLIFYRKRRDRLGGGGTQPSVRGSIPLLPLYAFVT